MSNTRRRQGNNSATPNFWGMIQTVLLSGMRNGQLILAALVIVLIIVFLRLDKADLYQLLNNIGDSFKDACAVGWILLAVFLLYGQRQFKVIRKSHQKEMDRCAEEKNKLMQKAFGGKKLRSSK
jgi:hypothetical protein